MKNVGIIANPFSGRDIRRFTSFAFSVTNPEKENMVTRMISVVRIPDFSPTRRGKLCLKSYPHRVKGFPVKP